MGVSSQSRLSSDRECSLPGPHCRCPAPSLPTTWSSQDPYTASEPPLWMIPLAPPTGPSPHRLGRRTSSYRVLRYPPSPLPRGQAVFLCILRAPRPLALTGLSSSILPLLLFPPPHPGGRFSKVGTVSHPSVIFKTCKEWREEGVLEAPEALVLLQ